MNNSQKQVQQYTLEQEQKTIRELKQVYSKAREDCEKKILELSSRTDMENLQSIIYQKQYQEALKKQLDDVLTNLDKNQYDTVDAYIKGCYDTGFTGAMYDLHNQGIPITTPIDQRQVVKAVRTDSQISKPMYTKMGEDVNHLKNSIRAELSRGVANGATWNQMASKIAKGMNSPFDTAFNKAVRIARTEGHRVQQSATWDAQVKAKQSGADVVKQWCATLDGHTRPSHMALDGQIVDIEEPFKNMYGDEAMFPSDFGIASEDINCRCCLLERAKWALDDDELQTLKERAEYFGLDKSDEFKDFREKYLKNVTDEKDVPEKVERVIPKTVKNDIPTKDEMDAVDYYVSGDGMYINHYLRDGDDFVEQAGAMRESDKVLVKDLESATNRPHDCDTLYRSVDASAVLGKISDSEYENLREAMIYGAETKKQEALIEKYTTDKVGTVITDNGFMSTTKEKGIALEFGDFTGSDRPVVIEFSDATNAKGFDLEKYIPSLESQMEQKEVLLHNNTKYQITDVGIQKDAEYGSTIYIKTKIIK